MRGRAAAALLAALTAAGCGPAALIHDAYIGPISPAGRIHPLVVGSEFRVDERGVAARAPRRGLLRPLPPDFIRRANFFVPLTRGIEFAIAGFSFFVEKDSRTGRAPRPVDPAVLGGRLTAEEVLRRLGPPRLWIKRASGSIMTYGSEVGHDLDIHIGVPPGVAELIPIPGVSNLRFAYSKKEKLPRRGIFFFDADDVLRSVAMSSAEPDE